MGSHMPQRVLVVNSNSNPMATEVIRVGLEPHIRRDTQVTYVTAELGPQGIDTDLDMAVAAVETAKLVAANRGAYDGFIIACGMDPGLDACRQIVGEPVVGLAEAAMLMACLLGNKFSILTTLDAGIPRVVELVAHYGLVSRLASVRAIEMSTSELADRELMFHRLHDAAKKTIQEDRAEVILLTGSVMAGLEARMAELVGAPVLAGLVCALKMIESLIDCGQKTSRAYRYRQLKKIDRLLGYERLQDVYGG